MKTRLFSTLAAAVLSLAGAASVSAQEPVSTGIIQGITPATGTLTIRSDQTTRPVTFYGMDKANIFTAGGKPALAGDLQAGTQVTVQYAVRGDRWYISKIILAEPGTATGAATATVTGTGTGTGTTAGGSAATSAVAQSRAATDGDITTQPGSAAAIDGDITTRPGSAAAIDRDITTQPGNAAAVDRDITTQPGSKAATDGDITTQPGNNAATDGDITTQPGSSGSTVPVRRRIP